MKLLAIRIRDGKVDVYALKRDSNCPTLDFFRLLKSDGSPDLGRLTRLLTETAQNGIIDYNENKFKNLKNGLYEFKCVGGARLFCFLDQATSTTKRLVICTGGVIKKKNRHAPQDIEDALKWRDEYLKAKTDRSLEFIDNE